MYVICTVRNWFNSGDKKRNTLYFFIYIWIPCTCLYYIYYIVYLYTCMCTCAHVCNVCLPPVWWPTGANYPVISLDLCSEPLPTLGYSSIPSGVCQCKFSFLFWIHQFSRGVGYSKVVAILKHESFLNKIKLIFLKIPLFQATCHSPPPKSQRVDELHLGNLWIW